jgi:hypothetical protein
MFVLAFYIVFLDPFVTCLCFCDYFVVKIASFEVSRVETQDGGDAKVEVSPRDIVYSQPAEPLEGEQPVILHKLDLRYGYEYKLLIHI